MKELVNSKKIGGCERFHFSPVLSRTSLRIVGDGKIGERQMRECVGVVGALGVVAVRHEAPGGGHGRREDGVQSRRSGKHGGDAREQVDELLIPMEVKIGN